MGGTLKRRRDQILNWHITGAPNGPTEALNLLIKKIKRVGYGFPPEGDRLMDGP